MFFFSFKALSQTHPGVITTLQSVPSSALCVTGPAGRALLFRHSCPSSETGKAEHCSGGCESSAVTDSSAQTSGMPELAAFSGGNYHGSGKQPPVSGTAVLVSYLMFTQAKEKATHKFSRGKRLQLVLCEKSVLSTSLLINYRDFAEGENGGKRSGSCCSDSRGAVVGSENTCSLALLLPAGKGLASD